MTLLKTGVNAQECSAELRLAPVPSLFALQGPLSFVNEKLSLLRAFSMVTTSSAVPPVCSVAPL